MLLLSDWISAEEAVDLGLASEVVDDDRLVERAMEIASKVAQQPAAVRTIKRLVRQAEAPSIDAAYEREVAAYAVLFGRSAG
jgi:enoyl-CoA hydratase/carnithine racemase